MSEIFRGEKIGNFRKILKFSKISKNRFSNGNVKKNHFFENSKILRFSENFEIFSLLKISDISNFYLKSDIVLINRF